ncbi:MAG: hypothetical protein ACI9LF_001169 [Flavobacteriales bacterium]|jgi:hypothetical protein
MDNTSYRKGHFPPQKLPLTKKTKKWFGDCIEAAEQLSFVSDSRIRQGYQNKKANYDLANDKLDTSDVKRVTNPYSIEGLTIPAKMQNYPIALPKIDLLVGEEMKRRFDWRVRVVNEDAVTQKEKELKKLVDETLVNNVTAGVTDKQEFEQRMKRLNRFKNYEYQDMRERRATQLLKYLWKKEDLENKFSRSFMDLLISSEEIMCVDIIAGEPVVRKVNPLELNVISNGDSPYVEDADIIIEDGYYPPGKVIDMYHDELSDKEVTRIMDGDLTADSGGNFSMGQRERSIIPSGEFEIVMDPETGQLGESEYSAGKQGYRGAFDLDGNVRIMRVVWRGVKKIGKVKYFDPQTQSIEEDIVPENYKKKEGEKVKWIWINEWNEGTMIGSGKDSIKVKFGPRPIQFRHMDNPSKCASGYVGTYMNINDSRAYSLLDRMKPYQYLYNVYMYRTEQAFAKSYGKILKLPLHLIPDNWDLDQWLNYLFQMNIMVTDGFKEGDKGASQGKLAGSIDSGNNMVADLEMGNYIQQHLMMLQYIKTEMGEIAGVSEQRQGQIEQRELVGNVQRAVTQSAHITEKWFKVHDNFKQRVLTLLLETAKFAYKGKTMKRQMILDDMTNTMFDIPGDEIMEADYGLFLSNTSADTELFADLKMLSQAALQNDKMTIGNIIDIYTSDSIASIKRKIELAEEERAEAERQQFEKQMEQQQQATQAQIQNEQEARQLEERMNVRDNQTKLLIEEMKLRAQSMEDSGAFDDGSLSLDLRKHIDAMAIKEKELLEDKRESDIKLKFDQSKQKDSMKMHNDKMMREDKKIKKMGAKPAVKK